MVFTFDEQTFDQMLREVTNMNILKSYFVTGGGMRRVRRVRLDCVCSPHYYLPAAWPMCAGPSASFTVGSVTLDPALLQTLSSDLTTILILIWTLSSPGYLS